MIIWAGYGFVIFIIVFVDALIAELISDAVTRNKNFYQENLDPMGISFIISGLIIYYLQKYFDKKRVNSEGTRVFDKITIAKKGHHLFFIPFAFWSYILVAIGTILIIVQYFR
jgi:hypothetical protein